VVREARSGERILLVTSAEKGSLGLILEPSASGSLLLVLEAPPTDRQSGAVIDRNSVHRLAAAESSRLVRGFPTIFNFATYYVYAGHDRRAAEDEGEG